MSNRTDQPAGDGSGDGYEEQQRALDPHRAEEQRRARQETVLRLERRHIRVESRDDDVALADLLDAVERFERAVEARGGDLMVDEVGAAEPDDAAYVLPARSAGESVADYRLRVEAAIDGLRHRRRR